MIRKAIFTALSVVIAAGTVGAALAQDGPQTRPGIIRADMPGRAVFEQQCAPCHGNGRGDDGAHTLPGTAALQAKYEGRLPAQLELREDLNVTLLRFFIRRGSGAMPAFRAAELTDAQIEQIAAYIAATAQATSAGS